MNRQKHTGKGKASEQKFIFKIIMVTIPVLILLIFEGLLRITGYGDNLDLFVQNPVEGYEKYMIVNPEIGKKYFQKLEYTAPANDIFLKDKPENTFRIFVMGSSVVYGFPYDRNLMFSRILHQRLADAYPGRDIEMVNTAITAVNSYTLFDFIGQILKYEPDAILIYAGHNEFYGAFGIGSNETMSRNRGITRLHIALLDSRIYQLIRNGISGTAKKITAGRSDELHGTLMKRVVKNKDILLYSEEYHIAMERYRQNLGDILEKAGKKQVPLFISDLVCNIHGMEPFFSIAKDTLEAAIDVFRKARIAEEDRDYKTALKLYYLAKDLDCIRFRASEDANSIIDGLAEEYHAFKVPMLSRFQGHSSNNFIGNNLMTEHVHPNVDGIFLMADAFYAEIVRSGILGEPDKYRNHTPGYVRNNWGYTALDTLLAHHRVQNLKRFWPFVMEETEGFSYRSIYRPTSYLDSLAFSVIRSPDLMLADVRVELARRYEKSGQIVKAYREYEALLRMNPYIAVNYRDAATCLLQLSDLPLALKYFTKSLEFEESFFACFRIAEIYLIMGDYNNAIRYFEKAFYLAPEENKINVTGKLYMACVYAGKTEQAEKLAAELRRVDAARYLNIPPGQYVFNNYVPFQTGAQVNKARELMKDGNDEEALALLESSLEIYDSHVARRYIGEIYLRKTSTEEAIYYFESIYEQYKFDSGFLHNLALLYLAEKNYSSAKMCLEGIRLYHPGYEYLELLTSMIL